MQSDAEVICEFMEPKPELMRLHDLQWHGARFRAGNWEYCPVLLTLDALREVEAKLTDAQWPKYEANFVRGSRFVTDKCAVCGAKKCRARSASSRYLLHADAPTKLKALAAVIRGGKPCSRIRPPRFDAQGGKDAAV